MKRRVSIRPEAQRDIREAAAWYESREQGVGMRFKNDVRATSRRIGENVLMFPAIDSRVRRALLRGFPYSVYFIVEAKLSRNPSRSKSTQAPGNVEDTFLILV